MPRPKLPPGAKRVRLDLTLSQAALDRLTTLTTSVLPTRSAVVEALVMAAPEPARRQDKRRR